MKDLLNALRDLRNEPNSSSQRRAYAAFMDYQPELRDFGISTVDLSGAIQDMDTVKLRQFSWEIEENMEDDR